MYIVNVSVMYDKAPDCSRTLDLVEWMNMYCDTYPTGVYCCFSVDDISDDDSVKEYTKSKSVNMELVHSMTGK